jgi:hypothetical protein
MTRELVIRTCHSRYCFTAVEPTGRLGLLSGGRLGGEARRAMLVGHEELRVGARAVFDVAAGDGVRRFTTSPICELGDRWGHGR